MKTTLVEFKPYGNGWEWTERREVRWGYGPTEIRLVPCRTNPEGEGFWENDSFGNEKQVLGTTQYKLPHDRKRARAKVARELRV